MPTDAPTRPEFRIERIFAAPRHIVWDAWTVPDQITGWFGPKGSRMTVITADIRPGGILHSRMDVGGGNIIYPRFVYREVVAPSRLVWEHGFGDAAGNPVPAFIPNFPATLLNIVEFEEEGEGTRAILTSTALNATPAEIAEFAAMFDSMNGGWGGSFEVLDDLLAVHS